MMFCFQHHPRAAESANEIRYNFGWKICYFWAVDEKNLSTFIEMIWTLASLSSHSVYTHTNTRTHMVYYIYYITYIAYASSLRILANIFSEIKLNKILVWSVRLLKIKQTCYIFIALWLVFFLTFLLLIFFFYQILLEGKEEKKRQLKWNGSYALYTNI